MMKFRNHVKEYWIIRYESKLALLNVMFVIVASVYW